MVSSSLQSRLALGMQCLLLAWVTCGGLLANDEINQQTFARELIELASICDQVGLQQEAELTRHWLPINRNDCRRLFLLAPPKLRCSTLSREAVGASLRAKWAQRFVRSRQLYAQWLVQQAESLTQAQQSHAAYNRLWEAIYHDDQNATALRTLGPLLSALDVRPRPRSAIADELQLGWAKGSYTRIQTRNFELVSRADNQQSMQVANQLESLYALWTQVFFPLWCSPDQLQSRLVEQSNQRWPTHDRLRVVLLEDRQAYIEMLGLRESNIQISTGYYNPELRFSFLYIGDQFDETFQHELTHQWLFEATGLNPTPDVGSRSDIWLLEGVAIYMESLRPTQSFWTVGGKEAPRVQTARYRALRDQFWPEWSSFTSAGSEQWKEDDKVALYYSQAAGIVHCLMDFANEDPTMPLEHATAPEQLQNALSDVYQGNRPSSNLLETIPADDSGTPVDAYRDAIKIDTEDLIAIHHDSPEIESLVLTGSQLDENACRLLGEFQSLTWLDLTTARLPNADFEWLSRLKDLERLSIEGTVLNYKQFLEAVATLPHLEDLDLSSCSFQVADLEPLRGNSSIKSLWLTNSPVDENLLSILKTLPSLQFCEVSGTKISSEAWQNFSAQHPNLKSQP